MIPINKKYGIICELVESAFWSNQKWMDL